MGFLAIYIINIDFVWFVFIILVTGNQMVWSAIRDKSAKVNISKTNIKLVKQAKGVQFVVFEIFTSAD